jgi:hypothetical protein
MEIIRSIEWQEVTSRDICGASPEVGRDGMALTHSVRETRPYRRSMNRKRIVQHRTHIRTLNPFTREAIIKHWLRTWICKSEKSKSSLCHALEIQLYMWTYILIFPKNQRLRLKTVLTCDFTLTISHHRPFMNGKSLATINCQSRLNLPGENISQKCRFTSDESNWGSAGE